ncbi:MAG: nucleotidyltransferase [Candidatus Aminicenantes bacterium]|nr:nucleotidyltransferase [Candidatus Aminicenantes bacterium]
MKPILVILAAGIGNRYGGLKQMDQVGPSGETIVDYAIYDAGRAGFGKVVFVIRKSIEKEFHEVFLTPLRSKLDIDYVFQELQNIPEGLSVPAGRIKPWGTSHAVLVSEPKVDGPFAAINADDFYGARAYAVMADFLRNVKADDASFSLVGYKLGTALSEHGTVARGVCEVAEKGLLRTIVERTCIEKTADGARFLNEAGQEVRLTGRETVSMNFWGFTPAFFGFARTEFEAFLKDRGNDLKSELYIPLVVNKLVKNGQASVKVLPSADKWFGVTYREDKPRVMAEIARLVAAGKYPTPLWR